MKGFDTTKEEHILTSRAKEFGELAAEREYEVHVSRFLTPAEQNLYYSALMKSAPYLRERVFFWGGAVGAERRACVILPSFIELSDVPSAEAGRPSFFSIEREKAFAAAAATYLGGENFGILPLKVSGSTYVSLSHRDYMGSILGLGVEREMIGDIVPLDEYSALIFTMSLTAPYLTDNLFKVGRDTVNVSAAEIPPDYGIVKKFENKVIVAASPRLDAVVAGFTGVSRSDAKEMCLNGTVDVNHLTDETPDRSLAEGDIVSVRGYGKFIVERFSGETRSGRLRLSVKKYV